VNFGVARSFDEGETKPGLFIAFGDPSHIGFLFSLLTGKYVLQIRH
jgi:hypothetical protein